MKPIHAIGTAFAIAAIVAVTTTVVRNSGNQQNPSRTTNPTSGGNATFPAVPTVHDQAAPGKKSDRPARPAPAEATAPAAIPNPPMAEAMGKIMETPVGREMMKQGIETAVSMQYDPLIGSLDLSNEDGAFFKSLLAKKMAGPQEIGMKLLSASPEEREKLVAEMEEQRLAADDEIRKFLNDEEDHQQLLAYEARLPEHQQMDGIRAAMESKNAPLDKPTEARLLEAMYEARIEASGQTPAESGDVKMSEHFGKVLEKQSELAAAKVESILSPLQLQAFKDQQTQANALQLSVLKMGEAMMPQELPAK